VPDATIRPESVISVAKSSVTKPLAGSSSLISAFRSRIALPRHSVAI